jgi:putative ABC transport system substrate-binding protein
MNGKMFIWILSTVLLATFFSAEAQQQSKKIPRIGYLGAASASTDAPRAEAFRQGLRDLGYIEGRNILIEYRYEERAFERLPDMAAELVSLKIDVLVTVTTNAALAAKNTTRTIPIVF